MTGALVGVFVGTRVGVLVGDFVVGVFVGAKVGEEVSAGAGAGVVAGVACTSLVATRTNANTAATNMRILIFIFPSDSYARPTESFALVS